MEFGYFTLSDNHYGDNPRVANQFISDITTKAIYADQLGMHSAWIGEHHFNALGVLSSPDLVLGHIVARTKHIRLAPAVTFAAPPSHSCRRAMGDARSALQRPGRFCVRPRLRPAANTAVRRLVRRQSGHLRRGHGSRPEALGGGWQRIDHHGKHYQFEDVRITPKPVQKPLPVYVGSFSKPSIELAARLGFDLVVAPFAAAMSYGGLKQVADLSTSPASSSAPSRGG